MLLSYKQKIVFGLLVLCAVLPIEARFKMFSKSEPSVPRQLRTQPSTSQVLQPLRQRPSSHSLESNSMVSINLKSPQSSSSSASSKEIPRSSSIPSLNEQQSPSILEMSDLHMQAAQTLNIPPAYQRNVGLGRLIPNLDRLNLIGKIMKNAAIGTAGTGGIILIANTFTDDFDEIINDERTTTMNKTTTTSIPELINPIGIDK